MYRSEFEDAALRTKRFGLDCPDLKFTEEGILSKDKDNRLPGYIRHVLGELTPKELHAQCLGIHLKLQYVVAAFFDCPCYYTIGYVEESERNLFFQTEESLLRTLKNGVTANDISLHAWLTLPSMEIMDFSLATTFAVIKGQRDGMGNIIAAHADKLPGGLKYHPLLIGDDFLYETQGIMQDSRTQNKSG
ncbi:MAG: hypothetical protein COB09_02495 [Thalassobium sp.]|nr:MAG: hypothetical protein COB09_02495 [Thalassobium sp.]